MNIDKYTAPSVGTSTTTWSYSPPPSPDPVEFTSSFEGGSFKQGVTIPNYHARKKRGELLPHTPFLQAEWDAKFVSGSFNSVKLKTPNKGNTASASNWSGVTVPGIAYRTSDFASDPDTAYFTSLPDMSYAQFLLQKSASAIYGQGFDALTFVSEFRKTARMFVGWYKRLLEWNTRKKTYGSQDLLNDWLEGRYGARTLAYDMKSLYHALVEMDSKRQLWSERQGYSYPESTTEVVMSGARIGNLTYTLTKTSSWSHSIRGSVSARITPPRVIINPVLTAWELVPYSFVLDWALGVGVWLESISFSLFAREVQASVGFKTEGSITYQLTGSGNSDFSGSASAIYQYSSVTESRTPSQLSIDHPRLTGRLLTSDLVLDLQGLSRLRSKRFR